MSGIRALIMRVEGGGVGGEEGGLTRHEEFYEKSFTGGHMETERRRRTSSWACVGRWQRNGRYNFSLMAESAGWPSRDYMHDGIDRIPISMDVVSGEVD